MIGRLCILPLLLATPAVAQRRAWPPEAQALAVKVLGFRGTARQPERFGAGVVVGRDPNQIFIVTAAHTLVFRPDGRPLRDPPDTLTPRVVLIVGDTVGVPARLVQAALPPLDIAVISVPAPAFVQARRVVGVPADRRGDVRSLRAGSVVWPIGCPGGPCFEVPAEPDRVMAIDHQGILFQSRFVQVGSSGGPLFNEQWEIVGMVIEDLTARATAISIDLIATQLARWGIPFMLSATHVPRGGYHASAGVSLLAPSPSPFDEDADRNIPSFRLTLVQQATTDWSWHLALMRLGPPDHTITGAMIGGQRPLSIGTDRLWVRPFIEAGVGQVEGRFDAGTYYVATPSGPVPQQSWTRVVDVGLGIGGGATFDLIPLPPLIFDVTVAYWYFTPPSGAAELNEVFVALGTRLGW